MMAGEPRGLNCPPQKGSHSEAKLPYSADLPKLKALWHDFHDAYDVEIYVVPTSPITSRPIDDVELYTTHNGHKVNAPHKSLNLAHIAPLPLSSTSVGKPPHCTPCALPVMYKELKAGCHFQP